MSFLKEFLIYSFIIWKITPLISPLLFSIVATLQLFLRLLNFLAFGLIEAEGRTENELKRNVLRKVKRK